MMAASRRRIAILAIALICVACLALAVFAINRAPQVMAKLLGLEHAGRLSDALPPDSPPLTLEGSQLDHVELLIPPHLSEPLRLRSSDVGGTPILGDASVPAASAYLLTLDEAGFNGLFQEIFPSGVGDERFRDVWIDLQPGGIVLRAKVDLGLRRQEIGLLLLQDSEGEPKLTAKGLVMEREFYALPVEEGLLTKPILSAEAYARHILESLTLVGPLPGEARVEDVRFHDDRVEILARATYEAAPPPDTGWRKLELGVEWREIDVTVDPARAAERLRIARLDPAQVRFRVHYDPANPRPVSEWAAQLQPLLVVNGSYFAPENESGSETVGLLISDGQRHGTSLGDFAGMFAVTAEGQVSLRWLREQPYDPEEPLTEAMQSFPVLVKPGGAMGFPADADDGALARRTVVAQDREGNILFIVAPRGVLSLHELAVFLTESDLGIDIALNLDGGASTGLWLESGDTTVEINSFTPVPSVIAAERR